MKGEKGPVKTTSSQTYIQMMDAICQTEVSWTTSLQMLDVAVQTVAAMEKNLKNDGLLMVEKYDEISSSSKLEDTGWRGIESDQDRPILEWDKKEVESLLQSALQRFGDDKQAVVNYEFKHSYLESDLEHKKEAMETEHLDEEEYKELIKECRKGLLELKLVKIDKALHLSSTENFNTDPWTPDDDLVHHLNVEEEGELTEFCTTLPWYEGRYHHCLICGKFYLLGTFSNHVLEMHSMSIVLYREKFPNDDLTPKLWNCSLCEKSLKWTQPSIARHLKSLHILNIQEYYSTILEKKITQTKQIHSDPCLPWFESTRHKCRICEKVYLLSQLSEHLRLKHSCKVSVYKKMFPFNFSGHSNWKCMICSLTTPWTKETIEHHLVRHEMTLDQYKSKFVEDNTTMDFKGILDQKSSNKDIGFASLDSLPKFNDGQKVNIDEENQVQSRVIRLEARESVIGKSMAKVGSDEKLWVPWFESKLHKCLICGEVRTCGLSFKNHIYDKHQYMSRKEYVKRYPTADIEPKPWNCPLCCNTVKWTKKCIIDHLKSSHAMTREEFETMFDMPAKHMVDAPVGGECNFNVRTDLGMANKMEKKFRYEDNKKITCRLCDETVDCFQDHLHNFHKMNEESYLKICPQDNFVSSSSLVKLWTCRLCEELVTNEEDKIMEHLKAHTIDLKEYEKTFNTYPVEDKIAENFESFEIKPRTETKDLKSDLQNMGNSLNISSEQGSIENEDVVGNTGSKGTQWYETIKIACKECENFFWLGQFMKHIILTHKMPIKIYKKKYPGTIIPKRLYICRICGIGVSHYASPISGHLTGRHNMTMTEYYEKFEKLQIRPPEIKPDIQQEVEVKKENDSTDEDNSNLDNPNVKNQRMAEFQKSGKIPWYECKTTICRFCNEEWLLGSFRRHLYDRHDKVSRTAYAEMFPDADISLPTWKCKICGNGIRWVRDNIFYHLRTHNFTMEGYRQVYIEGNGLSEQSLNKEMPYLVPISENITVQEEKNFRCRMCNLLLAFEIESIKGHLKTIHNINVEDYQTKYQLQSIILPGNLSSVLKEDKAINQNTEEKLKINPSNSCLVKSFKSPMKNNPSTAHSTPWYNKCTWTCMRCSKTFSSGFWRHIQEAHAIKKEDYLKEYGKQGIEIVHYLCKICKKKIPWSGASINAHTKVDHSMTLKEYESHYSPKLETCKKFEEHENVHVANISNIPGIKMQQLQFQVSQIHYVHSSNNWFNGCEYKCQLCGRILYSVAGLSMHLKETHVMDKYSYFRRFGRTGINIRKYTCKICLKHFPWSGVSLSKHVKQAHNISLQKYSNLYEQGSTTQSILDSVVPKVKSEIIEEITTQLAHKDKGLKWYNKCSWTCQICGTTISTNSSAFYKHVVQDHTMPIDEYKEKYGNTGFVFVDHTCKLCKKRVPFNGLSMCKHLKHSHKMQLEEYESKYMKDDDGTSTGEFYAPTDEFWYNKCMWKCQICGNKNKSLGSSKKHIHKVHNMPYEDYAYEHGTAGIYEVDFKCKICLTSMSCNGVTIASHLLNNHKLTLSEYEKEYLEKQECIEDLISNEQGQADGEHFLSRIQMEGNEKSSLTREEQARKDKPWYQKCKYFCQICNNPYFSISALRNHTKVKHNMDRDTYVSIYGVDAGKVIEDYICQICNRTLKCEGRSLNAHMRNCHKMGILEYSKKYESSKNTDEDPNYYSETYQIEMENDEYEVDDNVEKDLCTGILVEKIKCNKLDAGKISDESLAVDPLENLTTAEHEDDFFEEDMTVEESLHFNFEEEECIHETEIAGQEVKPYITKQRLNEESEFIYEMEVEGKLSK